MIPVTAYHLGDIVQYVFLKLRIPVPILPARGCHYHKYTQLIAGIHKSRILGIMGSTYNFTAGFAQLFGISPMLGIGHGITHISKILMPVGSDQLTVRLAIEPEALLSFKFSQTNSNTVYASVQHGFTLPELRMNPI